MYLQVLPPTTVTEANRDGLFGRIPRRVVAGEAAGPCVSCAVSRVLGAGADLANTVVVLVTGAPRPGPGLREAVARVREARVPVHLVSYPPSLHPAHLALAAWGGVYSVAETRPGSLAPLTHLQEIVASIVTRVEHQTVEKIHETHYNSLGFAGTFTFEKEAASELLITLNVPDEEKVELFEVKDPSGKKRIFSKFEDGMVYFKFSGPLPPGIWSYHAKLYQDSLYPDTKMVVDVVTRSLETTDSVVAEVFSSAPTTLQARAVNKPSRSFIMPRERPY